MFTTMNLWRCSMKYLPYAALHLCARAGNGHMSWFHPHLSSAVVLTWDSLSSVMCTELSMTRYLGYNDIRSSK